MNFPRELLTILPTVTPVATRGQMIPFIVHLGWAPGLVVRISTGGATIVSYAKVLERKVTGLDIMSFLLNNKTVIWNILKSIFCIKLLLGIEIWFYYNKDSQYLVNYYSLNKQRKPKMMIELGVSSNLDFDANTADMKIKYWYLHTHWVL